MTETTPQIDVYYSFRSPYCYLVIQRLYEWAEHDDVDIRIRPVYPLAISTPEFFANVNPLNPPYVKRDALREAASRDIPMVWPNPDPVQMTFKPLSIPKEQPFIHRLTRLACEADRQGKSLAFTREVSTLIWSGMVEDWSESDHLANAVQRAGLDIESMDRTISDDPEFYVRMIEQNHQDRKEVGHWGAPTMVYQGEPFFGQDRLDTLKWRISQGAS